MKHNTNQYGSSFRNLLCLAGVVLLPLGSVHACEDHDEEIAPLELLFEEIEGETEDFQRGVELAIEAGVSRVSLAEAHLFRFSRTRERPEQPLETLIRQYLDEWQEPDSNLFYELEEAEGFCDFVRGIDARINGDEDKFRSLMMSAIWGNPGLTQSVAEEIADYKKEAKIASIRIPLDLTLVESGSGDGVTLSSLLNGRRAVLVDFWAEWCGYCLEGMPELKELASRLDDSSVAVVAVNIDEEDADTKAERVRKQFEMEIPWLLDGGEDSLEAMLPFDSIPCVALIDDEGKVLFLGHPTSGELEASLERLASQKDGSQGEAEGAE